MPDENHVNPQVTDAVTQTNLKVLAEAPAEAMATVYAALAHSMSLAMESAQQVQSAMNQLNQPMVVAGTQIILAAGAKAAGN